MVYFKTNPTTSLFGGLRYRHYSTAKEDTKETQPSHSEVEYLAGVSHEINDNVTVRIEAGVTVTPTQTRNAIDTTLSLKF